MKTNDRLNVEMAPAPTLPADAPRTARSGYVRHLTLAAVLLLAAAATGADADHAALEQEIRDLTGNAAGRSAVPADERLRAVARTHSRDMYRARRLAHELVPGSGPGERVARAHGALFGLIAENVAYQRNWPSDRGLADEFVRSWLASPGHQRNIMAPYDAFEVGCHGDRTEVYCTQLFATSVHRLAVPVTFRQASGQILRLRMSPDPDPAGAEVLATARMSLARAGARPQDSGVAIEGHAAELPLPAEPGLHALHLWIRERGDPARYRIVPGPYLCITSPRGTRSDCGP